MATLVIVALALCCALLAVTCACLAYMVRELHADLELFSRSLLHALRDDAELPPAGSEPGP
jgi:hypothetical protein